MDNGYKQLRRVSHYIWKVASPKENWKYWYHFIVGYYIDFYFFLHQLLLLLRSVLFLLIVWWDLALECVYVAGRRELFWTVGLRGQFVSHEKEYVVINAIYFTPIFRFLLASNLYPAFAFLLRDWVVLLIIASSQGKQVNFSMITSRYKAGKNRMRNENRKYLGFDFFFFESTVHILVLLLFLLSVYHFLGLILPPSDFNFHWLQSEQNWAFYSKLLFSFSMAKNRLNWQCYGMLQIFVIFTQDSTLCHSMPLWKNVVEFNVNFLCVFPSSSHQKHLLVKSNFHIVKFP